MELLIGLEIFLRIELESQCEFSSDKLFAYLNIIYLIPLFCPEYLILVIQGIIIIPLSWFIGDKIEKKFEFIKKIPSIFLICIFLITFFVLAFSGSRTALGRKFNELQFVRKDQKYDQTTIEILEDELTRPINCFYAKKGKLPNDLVELKNFIVNDIPESEYSGWRLIEIVEKTNWENHMENYLVNLERRGLGYKKTGDIEYELCGNFKTKLVDVEHLCLNGFNGYEEFWHHEKGRVCFEKKVDYFRSCYHLSSKALDDLVNIKAAECLVLELDSYLDLPGDFFGLPEELDKDILSECKEQTLKYIDREGYEYLDESYADFNNFHYSRLGDTYRLCVDLYTDNTMYNKEIEKDIQESYLCRNGYFDVRHKVGEYCFDSRSSN